MLDHGAKRVDVGEHGWRGFDVVLEGAFEHVDDGVGGTAVNVPQTRKCHLKGEHKQRKMNWVEDGWTEMG